MSLVDMVTDPSANDWEYFLEQATLIGYQSEHENLVDTISSGIDTMIYDAQKSYVHWLKRIVGLARPLDEALDEKKLILDRLHTMVCDRWNHDTMKLPALNSPPAGHP